MVYTVTFNPAIDYVMKIDENFIYLENFPKK